MTRHTLPCRVCGAPAPVDESADEAICGLHAIYAANAAETARVEAAAAAGRCVFHPRYKAVRPPRSDCRTCWAIFNGKQEGEG